MTTRSTRRAKSAGVRSPDRPGRRDAETVDAGSPAGGGGRRLRRADSGAAGLSRGYYSRSLVTRIGKLELRVPRARDGRCSPERFAQYQRSEKALVSALAEMSVQGVSTRTVKVITDELCPGPAVGAAGALRSGRRLRGDTAATSHGPSRGAGGGCAG